MAQIDYHIDDGANEDDADEDADVDVAPCAFLRQQLRRPLEPAERQRWHFLRNGRH